MTIEELKDKYKELGEDFIEYLKTAAKNMSTEELLALKDMTPEVAQTAVIKSMTPLQVHQLNQNLQKQWITIDELAKAEQTFFDSLIAALNDLLVATLDAAIAAAIASL